MSPPAVDVVVPTVGRRSLRTLLRALEAGDGPRPARVIVVDDRRGRHPPLFYRVPPGLAGRIEVWTGRGAGPAAARNVGWQAATAEWIAFLDDDVVPDRHWLADLHADLATLPPGIAASQGRIVVPRPAGRRPTDWERSVIGLETARWATADMAVRRRALADVGGFDERFPRAYREDTDLGLRLVARGHRIVPGRRHVLHPVRQEGFWISVLRQRGNQDDVLMQKLHGRTWRLRACAPRGRCLFHLATVAAAVVAIIGWLAGFPAVALAGLALWALATLELAWARIRPGPRTVEEIATMLVTSVVLPFAAAVAWLGAQWRLRRGVPDAAAAPTGRPRSAARVPMPSAGPHRPPELVLFDRDGTLIVDVPNNRDPGLVVPLPTARAALDRLRAAGIRLAVVSNQEALATGRLTARDLAAVNAAVEHALGRFTSWFVCPHAARDACECRKPAPGMIRRALRELGVAPERCALVGDIGADVEAARAAGVRAVLVPTPITRREEIAAAPEVARDLLGAADLLLGRHP